MKNVGEFSGEKSKLKGLLVKNNNNNNKTHTQKENKKLASQKTENESKKTNEKGVRKGNQMTALGFHTRGEHQTSPAYAQGSCQGSPIWCEEVENQHKTFRAIDKGHGPRNRLWNNPTGVVILSAKMKTKHMPTLNMNERWQPWFGLQVITKFHSPRA